MRLIVFQTTKESQDHWNSLPSGALVVVVVVVVVVVIVSVVVSRKKEKERRVQVDNHYY
jgi:ABC-type phosphate transport system permease subunit